MNEGKLPYKSPWPEWLKQQKFVFLQFWRLEVRDHGAAWLGSGEDPLSFGLVGSHHLECAHMDVGL